MKIGKREIGNFKTPYVVAELGANHNGDMKIAKRLIDTAKKAGCDCVKFQSWTKESLFTKKIYEVNPLTNGRASKKTLSLEKLIEKYSISENQLRAMSGYCKKIGIDFACSPFSRQEVDALCSLKVPFIKVASMDLTNYDFLEYIAKKNIPVMLSTGLGTLAEIKQAVRTIEKAGNRQLMILHCVSIYPLPDALANLNNLDMLRDRYPNYPIGFSDHSLGYALSVAAVAKGAAILEKHFTLDKDMPGWDHKVSVTPEEMSQLVQGAHRASAALGSYHRVLSSQETANRPAYRRSIVAAREICEGQTIRREDLDVKRPGTGLEPRHLGSIVGRKAKKNLHRDELLMAGDF